MTTDLFNIGHHVLHSGFRSLLKIDCDALNDTEIYALALCVANAVPEFGEVAGVPTGGTRLAQNLKLFATPEVDRLLIVDDVLTTGASIIDIYRQEHDLWAETIGAVLFARGPCPSWVTPIFTLNSTVQEKLTDVEST